MYEKQNQQPISAREFRQRLINHLLVAAGLLVFSLAIGTAGHVYWGEMDWQQGFLNSSFLLSGIGLVVFPETGEGQLFVSFFALYSGLVFLVVSGIVIAPVLHRFLHKFHWIDDNA